MQLRIALALTGVVAAAALAACSTGGEPQQSIEDMARAACVDENTPANEMAACVEETKETLRRAREYSPPPPPRPPSGRR